MTALPALLGASFRIQTMIEGNPFSPPFQIQILFPQFPVFSELPLPLNFGDFENCEHGD